MQLLLSVAVFAIVAWLIARALHQRTLLRPLAPSAPPAADAAAELTVIVPARDEAANIEGCLQALLAQTYPAQYLRILVVDDHSSDATAALAQAIAAAHPQVELLASPPLPAGWTGKSHACWIGAGAAAPAAQWLCFLDADVRAAPELLASAVAAAASEKLDLLSLAPRQELLSFAERLILPCGLYLLAFCQDLRKLQSRERADTTATGQFMLVRCRAYYAAGGHATVRREICEDLALARLLKRSGAVLLRDGSRLLTTRMYTGWDTLWPGIAKNLVEMLGGPRSTVATALAAVTLAWALWLLPLADGLSCARGSAQGCIALVPALAAALAALGLHVAGAAYFRIPLWYGLLFPLGYTAGALMAADSLRWRWRGRVRWKGRVYS